MQERFTSIIFTANHNNLHITYKNKHIIISLYFDCKIGLLLLYNAFMKSIK